MTKIFSLDDLAYLLTRNSDSALFLDTLATMTTHTVGPTRQDKNVKNGRGYK